MGMIRDSDNAACNLTGLLLQDRWKVLERLQSSGGTGGTFSIRYRVVDVETGEKAFLKALNYKAFFTMSRDKDPVKILQRQNSAFDYERELLQKCVGKGLSKITRLLDTGIEYLDQYAYGAVPYLVLEMADGDIHTRIDFSNKIDVAWKLKSLHNVAVGLSQLHSIGIGHQDIKASNILLYENGSISKIGDLGNSISAESLPSYLDVSDRFTGDSDYTPIEYLYRHSEPDQRTRLRSIDMYLFGSLICFYFTGVNMTTLVFRNIPRQFRWTNWAGSFSTVRDYLVPSFYRGIKEFKREIPFDFLADDLGQLLEYACFPYPEKRGHPSAIALKNGNQYDFQRFHSKLDILSQKVELKLIRDGNNI